MCINIYISDSDSEISAMFNVMPLQSLYRQCYHMYCEELVL